MTEPERFDRYMQRCLYGEQGFYRSGTGAAGRRRDFLTSPEVGPLFGAVVARWLDRVWEHLGRPTSFPVIDAGSGPGTMLRSLQLAAPACATAWELTGVDPVTGTLLPERLDGAVVIANELLDNLPFRIIERTPDMWCEVVIVDGTESLITMPADDVERLPPMLAVLPVGLRAPWHEVAADWIRDVSGRGARVLVAFDYGLATTIELVERGGWLRTYRHHQRGDDPLVEPGSWDITTDVGFDQLGPTSLESQASFLIGNGIESLVAEGRRLWRAAAARPDLDAIRMRSRVRESEALLDPTGLGSWLVGVWDWSGRPGLA